MNRVYTTALFLVLIHFAYAQTIQWDGSVNSGDWSVDANWIGGVAPGLNDNVLFDLTGGTSYNVTLDISTQVNSITIITDFTKTGRIFCYLLMGQLLLLPIMLL